MATSCWADWEPPCDDPPVEKVDLRNECVTCCRRLVRPREWYSCEYDTVRFYFCGIYCMREFSRRWRSKLREAAESLETD